MAHLLLLDNPHFISLPIWPHSNISPSYIEFPEIAGIPFPLISLITKPPFGVMFCESKLKWSLQSLLHLDGFKVHIKNPPKPTGKRLHPANRPGKGPKRKRVSGDLLVSGRVVHHILSYVRSQFLDVLQLQPEYLTCSQFLDIPPCSTQNTSVFSFSLGFAGKPRRNNTWPLFLCLRGAFLSPIWKMMCQNGRNLPPRVLVGENWKTYLKPLGRWS